MYCVVLSVFVCFPVYCTDLVQTFSYMSFESPQDATVLVTVLFRGHPEATVSLSVSDFTMFDLNSCLKRNVVASI